MTRIRSLDPLRVAMCIGIAVFHARSYQFMNETGAVGTYLGRLAYFTDVFFVVTGFLTAKAYGDREGYGMFIRGRLARLLPLHLLTSAAMIPAVIYVKGESLPAFEILANLGLLNAWGVSAHPFALNGPAWFLSAALACFLVYPAAYALTRWRPIAGLALVIASAALGHYAMRHHPAGMSQAQTFGIGVLRGLPSFLAGLALARINFPDRWPAIPAATLAWCVGRFLFGPVLYDLDRLALVYLAVAALLWLDACGRVLTLGPLDRLARYSFGVFLIHVPVMRVVSFALPAAYKAQDTALSVPAIAACTALSFALAALSLRYVETPAARWLSRPVSRRAQLQEG